MPPPLINDYKKVFVLKRLIQTLLGGARVINFRFTFIILQILIFIIPIIIVSLVNLNNTQDLDIQWKSIINGCSLFLVDLCLVLVLGLLIKKRRVNTGQIAPNSGNNVITSTSDYSNDNPERGGNDHVSSRESVVAGDMGNPVGSLVKNEDEIAREGCCHPSSLEYISPNVTNSSTAFLIVLVTFSSFAFGLCTPLMTANALSPILRGFAIFAASNARYSAVICTPPELATFSATDKSQMMYRIFYTTLISGSYVILSQFLNVEDDYCFITAFSAVLAFAPLLWAFGLFPPLDAFFPWAFETTLFLLGGTSPSFYYAGTLISLIVVIFCPIMVFITTQQPLLIMLIECICGYIISCDTGLILSLKPGLCEETPTKAFLRQLLYPFLNIVVSLVCILIAWMNLGQVSAFEYELSFSIITLLISTCSWTFRFFIIRIHNPKKLILIPMHILHGLLPFILHIWLTLLVEHEKNEWSSLRVSVQTSLARLVPYLLTIRAFSLALVEPRKSSIDFSLTFFIRQYFVNDEEKFSSILILFFISLITGRISRFFKHFKTICSIWYAFTVSTILEPKKFFFAAISLALSPLSLISLLLTSLIEGTNLIGIFTLPTFILGFPRPSTFWKENWLLKRKKKRKLRQRQEDNEITVDWKIYSEIAPLLACGFSRKAHSSKLKFNRGNCFLSRYEDRLLFLRVISSGWNYVYLQIKGLEMQEQTSCHHQEAAKIDELFDLTLNKNAKESILKQMQDFFSLLVLSPTCTLKLPTYSESKSNISILSNEDEKSIFRDMFYRAFSYLWIKNNPALKGESYHKEITKNTVTRKTERFTREAIPNLDSDIVDTNPITSSEEFSFNNALFRCTKPTVNFLKVVESTDSTGSNSNNDDTSSQIDNTDTSAHLDEDVDQMPQQQSYNRPRSLSQAQLFSRESTRSTFDELDLKRNDSSSDRLSTIWIKQCVGDVIPSNAVKVRVEKICKSIWDSIMGVDEDREIDLSEFFHEDFSRKLKSLGSSRRVDTEQIALKAFRYASKLALDEIFTSATYASSSKVLTIDAETEEEIFSQLTLFERDYQFCPTNEISMWIQENANHIITISKMNSEVGGRESKHSVMRLLNYETEGVEFKIGQLDQYTVESIWSNLSLEMLYMTSDDDERFSIQNDRILFRNIVTQCAKPPLGYPVYDAIYRVNLHNFSVTQIQ